MLNFLARLMGLIVVSIFMLALGFFVMSSYLGLDFEDKLELPEQKSNYAYAKADAALDSFMDSGKDPANDSAIVSSLDGAQKLTAEDKELLEQADLAIDDLEFVEPNQDLEIEYEVLQSLSLSNLANLLKTGEKVLVVLDNSVLDSPMYNNDEQVLTEVVTVDSKVVETKDSGMYINSRYIYPINDFVKAFLAGGQIALKL